MHKTWQLQEAKNRFSEVVDKALKNGPQTVQRRGKDVVVVVSVEQFRKLKRPTTGLIEFFRSSPLCGVDLELTRSKEPPREIDI